MLSYEHDDDGNVTYKLRSGHSKKLHKRNRARQVNILQTHLPMEISNGMEHLAEKIFVKNLCTKILSRTNHCHIN